MEPLLSIESTPWKELEDLADKLEENPYQHLTKEYTKDEAEFFADFFIKEYHYEDTFYTVERGLDGSLQAVYINFDEVGCNNKRLVLVKKDNIFIGEPRLMEEGYLLKHAKKAKETWLNSEKDKELLSELMDVIDKHKYNVPAIGKYRDIIKMAIELKASDKVHDFSYLAGMCPYCGGSTYEKKHGPYYDEVWGAMQTNYEYTLHCRECGKSL